VTTTAVLKNEDQLAGLWREYKGTNSRSARDRLVEHYLPIVRPIAGRMRGKLPPEVRLDDLVASGNLGLLKAVHSFDPDKGIRFETYAAHRIRGAILDDLRSIDWAPRQARNRAHQIRDAMHDLRSRLGRRPTEGELASDLGVKPEEMPRFREHACTAGRVSLNQPFRSNDEEDRAFCEGDVLQTRGEDDPARQAMRKDLMEYVTHGLSHSERLAVVLYYCEGMSMKEVGAAMNLSESRICQMHSAIMSRLRERFAPVQVRPAA